MPKKATKSSPSTRPNPRSGPTRRTKNARVNTQAGSPTLNTSSIAVGQKARMIVDERRAQLIELGLHQFGSRPYDEVSIDELAKAAGISKGLLYHYFPTKRDYYVAAIEVAAQQLWSKIESLDPNQGPDNLRAGVEAYLDHVDTHSASYCALMRGGIGVDSSVFAIIDRTRNQIIDRIVEYAPPLTIPTELVRITLKGWIGFVESVALEWLITRKQDRKTITEIIINALPTLIAILPLIGSNKDNAR